MTTLTPMKKEIMKWEAYEKQVEAEKQKKRELRIDPEGAEKLAKQIVIQAVIDYRNLCLEEAKCLGPKAEYRPRVQRNVEKGYREIERFFSSQWFQMLTDLDGSSIMKKLKEEKVEILAEKKTRRSDARAVV